MAYFRPSQERAFVSKRFLTAREVEDMAAAGAVEIVQVDGMVITDAARETAHDLGLRIKQPDRQTQQDTRPVQREREAPPPVVIDVPQAPTAPVTITRAAATGSCAVAPQFRGAPSGDPLLQALIHAVRSNRSKLAAIAEGT